MGRRMDYGWTKRNCFALSYFTKSAEHAEVHIESSNFFYSTFYTNIKKIPTISNYDIQKIPK